MSVSLASIKIIIKASSMFMGVVWLKEAFKTWEARVVVLSTFLACLPVSFEFSGQTVSGNYLFVLFPLAITLIEKDIILPPKWLLIIFLYFLVLYIYSIIKFADNHKYLIRSFISGAIFLSPFTFVFVKNFEKYFEWICWGLMISGIYLSCITFGLLFYHSGFDFSAVSFRAFGFKDLVGSNREGLVYFMAGAALFSLHQKQRLSDTVVTIISFALFWSLLATFSRASVVSFLVAGILLFCTCQQVRNLVFSWTKAKTYNFLFFCALCIVFSAKFPNVPYYYMESLVQFFGGAALNLADGGSLNTFQTQLGLDNPVSSEGFRVAIFWEIIANANNNFWTGSGFLGVWILNSDLIGSAHSQYGDVLFRVGYPGFFVYLVLLAAIGFKLRCSFQYLYYSFLTVLIYGFFHETFKEPFGGFTLAILLGLVSQTSDKKWSIK